MFVFGLSSNNIFHVEIVAIHLYFFLTVITFVDLTIYNFKLGIQLLSLKIPITSLYNNHKLCKNDLCYFCLFIILHDQNRTENIRYILPSNIWDRCQLFTVTTHVSRKHRQLMGL